MHDVEGSVQELVCLLDPLAISDGEKRSLIYNLYKFHDQWDVGFTRFRTYNILVETGFFHFFEMEEHPDYEKYKDYFESIRGSELEWIYDDPLKGYEKGAKENSYWFGTVYDDELEKDIPLGKMCCEPGMRMWRHFKGDDGYREMSEPEMFARLAELAVGSEHGDRFLSEIYHLMLYVLSGTVEEKDRKFLERLKELVLTEDVMRKYHHGDSVFYAKPDLLDEEFLELADEDHREWMQFYFDCAEEWDAEDEDPGGDDEVQEDGDRSGHLRQLMNDYKEMILSGDMESVYREYAALSGSPEMMEILDRSYLDPGIRMFELIPESEYHETTMTRDLNEIVDLEYRRFVEQYRVWYPRKDDVKYYKETAREFLNSDRTYDAYITAESGLLRFPDDPDLKLYRASCIIHMRADDEFLETELRTIEHLEKQTEAADWKAYMHYLKGVGLYYLGRMEEAGSEFMKATEIDETYKEQYDQYLRAGDGPKEQDLK